MAEPLLGDLGVNAACEKMRRVRMPQVVEPDARQITGLGREADKFMREAVRLQWLAIDLRDNVGLVAPPDFNCTKSPTLNPLIGDLL
jgi:hypothetical protein